MEHTIADAPQIRDRNRMESYINTFADCAGSGGRVKLLNSPPAPPIPPLSELRYLNCFIYFERGKQTLSISIFLPKSHWKLNFFAFNKIFQKAPNFPHFPTELCTKWEWKSRFSFSYLLANPKRIHIKYVISIFHHWDWVAHCMECF